MKLGSDYWDRCTQLCNILQTDLASDTPDCLSRSFAGQKSEASVEFDAYITIPRSARDDPSSGTLHIVFNFAEKVLLPSLLRQQGQLHFVTALKFDFFGESVSQTRICD